jgi:hypothetical protein
MTSDQIKQLITKARKAKEMHDIKELIEKYIKQIDGKWCVIAESGKSMGCYPTKKEAVTRLRQIEGHKMAADLDNDLYIGMSEEQVIEVMGKPSGRSEYVSSYDNAPYISVTLDYNDGNTSIHLESDRVTGWSIQTGSRIIKSNYVKFAATDEEKRLVHGIVMEPDSTDTDGETTDADEIEKAAHRFLERSRVMGDTHKKRAKAVPVESYITSVELTLGEQPVKKGSWVMVSRVDDDTLWKGIKDGDYTGYSIGAYVKREEIEETEE